MHMVSMQRQKAALLTRHNSMNIEFQTVNLPFVISDMEPTPISQMVGISSLSRISRQVSLDEDVCQGDSSDFEFVNESIFDD